MSALRSNLVDRENRPLKSTQIVQLAYDDTGYYTVGMKLDGFTTIPCDDNMYETRAYEFPDPAWAIDVGIALIRSGINSKFKNLKHKKKQ